MKMKKSILIGACLAAAFVVNANADDAMPLPSIRGMYCNNPCSGVPAPDRHMGELAVLAIFRKQCIQEEEQGGPLGVARLMDYRFRLVWQEWNAARIEAKQEALKHELAAIDARRHKYGERYGGWTWFCNVVSERINKGDYRDLETGAKPAAQPSYEWPKEVPTQSTIHNSTAPIRTPW